MIRHDAHYDEAWLATLADETRRQYLDTQERDAAALADLLRDQFTFPPNDAPSALLRFWQSIDAAPNLSR